MQRALISGWFPPGTSLEAAARRTREFGLDSLGFDLPGPVPPGERCELRAHGVVVPAVVLRGAAGAASENSAAFARDLGSAAVAAEQMRAACVVVEGGDLGGAGGGDPGGDEARRIRRELAAAATERAARALHRALGAGVPLGIRNGGSAGALLGLEETGWLLDDLPRLTLYFDAARALRLARLGLGDPPEAWADRLAPRVGGVFVQGLGGDVGGGAHPQEGNLDWAGLVGSLPGRAPWILDVGAGLSPADVADALAYLADLGG